MTELKVLCLSTLPTAGAGNRLRFEQYTSPLRALGIRLEMSPFFDDRGYRVLYREGHFTLKVLAVARGIVRRIRDAARVGSFDLVVVYRESVPLGPPFLERFFNSRRIPFVFDFDDAIFLGPIHPANRRWSWLRHPSRVAETARRARSVIVPNEYLANWARLYNRNVTVIPTAVDTGRHRPMPRPRDGWIVLVWSGSSTTAPYLHLLDAPLAELARRRSDLALRAIGGPYEHDDVLVDQVVWDLEREPVDVAAGDIGVLPEPDDPWTRGKGAFKALLYMAAGLPVVASEVGVNPDVVVDGETGYCVTGDAGWIDAIARLASDPGLRAAMGKAGRRRVEEHYSVKVQAPRLEKVLRDAVGTI